jgi:hypothetical protein
MPKFSVQVQRVTAYEVEAGTAREAANLVLGDGIEDIHFKEVAGETTAHWVYDEAGNEVTEENEE